LIVCSRLKELVSCVVKGSRVRPTAGKQQGSKNNSIPHPLTLTQACATSAETYIRFRGKADIEINEARSRMTQSAHARHGVGMITRPFRPVAQRNSRSGPTKLDGFGRFKSTPRSRMEAFLVELSRRWLHLPEYPPKRVTRCTNNTPQSAGLVGASLVL
jgi:hypothetical protein